MMLLLLPCLALFQAGQNLSCVGVLDFPDLDVLVACPSICEPAFAAKFQVVDDNGAKCDVGFRELPGVFWLARDKSGVIAVLATDSLQVPNPRHTAEYVVLRSGRCTLIDILKPSADWGGMPPLLPIQKYIRCTARLFLDLLPAILQGGGSRLWETG